ncbi:alpha/beta hydrolase fold domain-containing protein [Mariniflexile ostreae]|uniref:Alpha/beta hydrolase fold domain-containing protein n=1 Tax=Mariniflexile ostreae TaxID=1520892 RepID=A0ABV5FFF0_9FLAO
MKAIKPVFFYIIVGLTTFSCSKDTDNTTILPLVEPYHEQDVYYGPGKDQSFDIYLPANRNSDTKTIILVHGGGWSGGDKKDMNAFKDLILQEFPSLAIVNMNYRLADHVHAPYPMQIDDITTVVDELKNRKNDYNISEKIGFIGTSAGAHLALLWSYAFSTHKNVEMVCSMVGPTNFTDPAYLNNTNPELQGMIDLFGIKPEIPFLKKISPYHQATASSPPTILFYGAKDPLIPVTQGTAMRDKLISLNVSHEFILYSNGGHGWVGPDLLDTWIKLKTFMQAHL